VCSWTAKLGAACRPVVGREDPISGIFPEIDLTPFRSTRFAEGKPWRDEHNYGVARATISR